MRAGQTGAGRALQLGGVGGLGGAHRLYKTHRSHMTHETHGNIKHRTRKPYTNAKGLKSRPSTLEAGALSH
jgi:hypothetical protein